MSLFAFTTVWNIIADIAIFGFGGAFIIGKMRQNKRRRDGK